MPFSSVENNEQTTLSLAKIEIEATTNVLQFLSLNTPFLSIRQRHLLRSVPESGDGPWAPDPHHGHHHHHGLRGRRHQGLLPQVRRKGTSCFLKCCHGTSHGDARTPTQSVADRYSYFFTVVMGPGHADTKDSCPKCGGKVLLVFKCCHRIRAHRLNGLLPDVRRKGTPSFLVLSWGPGTPTPRTPVPSAAERYSLVFSVVMGSWDSCPKCGGKVLLVFWCFHGIQTRRRQGLLLKVRRKGTHSFSVLSRHPGTIKV